MKAAVYDQELRVHTEWQSPLYGVYYIMMEKISPVWWGCGVHAHLLSLYLPSRTKLWCMLRGQIHFPYFYSTPIHVCTVLFDQDNDNEKL
jgi:hypothetical protein